MGNLLWLIIIVLVILWLGGFALHIGGGLIHILIVTPVIFLWLRSREFNKAHSAAKAPLP